MTEENSRGVTPTVPDPTHVTTVPGWWSTVTEDGVCSRGVEPVVHRFHLPVLQEYYVYSVTRTSPLS